MEIVENHYNFFNFHVSLDGPRMIWSIKSGQLDKVNDDRENVYGRCNWTERNNNFQDIKVMVMEMFQNQLDTLADNYIASQVAMQEAEEEKERLEATAVKITTTDMEYPF